MPQLIVDQVIDSAALGLEWGSSDLIYVEIGERRVIYILSRSDGDLVELEMSADGIVSVVQKLPLDGGFQVGSTPEVTVLDGSLAISGLTQSDGQFVSLSADGSLGSQYSETSVGEFAEASWVGDILVTVGEAGDGLATYRDQEGSFVSIESLSDNSEVFLGDVTASAAVSIAGKDFVAVTSGTENGVTLVEIDALGGMTVGASFGTLDGLPIHQPSDIKVIEQLGGTMLVIASSGTSSLSTVRVDSSGSMWLSDHILDSSNTQFQAISSIDTVTVGDFSYVVAGGPEGGVSLFTVLQGGRMVHLSSISDTSSTTLYRLSALSVNYANGALQILGGSAWEAGLTRLTYDLATQGSVLLTQGSGVTGTALDDQIIGSDTGEAMNAGAGDDIIYDGHGSDTLTGGDGADLFVLALDGASDEILDFERGVDRLDLSGFDFLHDVSQLSVAPTANGALVTFAEEALRIYSNDGGSLTALDFSNSDILNVDRPPLLAVNQTLLGGSGADALTGSTGNDTISGLDSDDLLSGRSGDDFLFGGNGADTLEGGPGGDTINGDAGGDLILGGADDDMVNGGAGGDVIYGDEIA